MNTISILAQQHQATFNLTEWFVSLERSISGVSEEEAKRKLNPDSPSVFEIVSHIYYWHHRHLMKIQNVELDKWLDDNSKTFETQNNFSWNELVEMTKDVFIKMQKEIELFDKSKDSDLDWISIFSNINLHNAYHIGQIVMIRRMNKCWDKKLGVD